jgi:hypothetical protein
MAVDGPARGRHLRSRSHGGRKCRSSLFCKLNGTNAPSYGFLSHARSLTDIVSDFASVGKGNKTYEEVDNCGCSHRRSERMYYDRKGLERWHWCRRDHRRDCRWWKRSADRRRSGSCWRPVSPKSPQRFLPISEQPWAYLHSTLQVRKVGKVGDRWLGTPLSHLVGYAARPDLAPTPFCTRFCADSTALLRNLEMPFS